ncbi:DUF4267 domain-containing protein [Niabella beijingensis]|uniref:DUF4267 domain-containing protein n=1 Tax=Niabella beijingensis TaxID=2872700 RepID=UPI001CBF3BB1|nr:DUF4267 domain-containing protein [Niabella beijingensis]MBZ4189608.1 DUF4267 domain-containing protein [Niabella beijingensis]
MTTKIALAVCLLTGLGLLFIGARFLLDPEVAMRAYGVNVDTSGDFSFHMIKGIRDLFSGLLILLLVCTNQRRALGISLLAATVVPFGDLLIVWSKNDDLALLMPHLTAVLICIIIGPLLLVRKKKVPVVVRKPVQVIHSAASHAETVTEATIYPGDKTPWHYHTLFAETFELLEGRLQVGKSGNYYQLKKGDRITIDALELHSFYNNTGVSCRIRTLITPGNLRFEQAGQILTGLANDGLANKRGIPKRLTDLALFLYLSDSKPAGMAKMAVPLFALLAWLGRKCGRLNALINRYCFPMPA